MSWFTEHSTRDGIVTEAPSLKNGFDAFYQSFHSQSYVPVQTLELCRLRVAQLHQSETEFARVDYSLEPELKAALSQWSQSALYSEAEKLSLSFAEVYTMDPQAISDDDADGVKMHYGDAGLIVLIEALGVYYGMTRVSQIWEL